MSRYAILTTNLLNQVKFNKITDTSSNTVRMNADGTKFIVEYETKKKIPTFLLKLYIENKESVTLASQEQMYIIMDSEEWNPSNNIAVDDLKI